MRLTSARTRRQVVEVHAWPGAPAPPRRAARPLRRRPGSGPRARSRSPAPPSVVADPPTPRRISRQPRPMAAARTWPVPNVEAARASRSSGATQRQAGRRGELHHGPAGQRRRAGTAPPRAARADRRAAAGRACQPPAAMIASSVPSPPSASGTRCSSSSGRARRQPSARARATATLVSEPLNESGAMSTRTAVVSRPRAVERRPRPRGAPRTPGCRIIGGRSASASSMTSSDRWPGDGAGQLHRRAELGEEPRPAALLEPLHDRLEDHEAHPRQALQLLVAVHPPLQVDLAKAVQAEPLREVDEVADLDRVAGEERDRLEMLAPARVLAGERLDQARQLGEEQVDERPRHELRDPAAAALLEHAALDDRALVVALDVADARLGQQRAERAVDQPRVPVPDVRVAPDDEVAARLVQALPERLALAAVAAVARQHVRVEDHARALALGDRRGCRRSKSESMTSSSSSSGDALHQLAPRRRDDRPDRLRLVEGGQDQADRQPLLLLERRRAGRGRRTPRGGSSTRRTSARPARGRRASGSRGTLRGRQRLGLRWRAARTSARLDRLARLDDDDRRPGAAGRPSPAARRTARRRGRRLHAGRRRGAHDHELGRLRPRGGSALRDVRAPRARAARRRAVGVLADERGQRALRLGPDRRRRPGGTTCRTATSAS